MSARFAIAAPIFGSVVLLVAALARYSSNSGPSAADAGAKPGSEAVLVPLSATTVDLGTLRPNAEYPVSFKVKNVLSEPVTILGASTTCSCTIPSSMFPVVVPPKSVTDVRFVIHSSREPLDFAFHYKIALICDVHGEWPKFDVVGQMGRDSTADRKQGGKGGNR